MTTRPDIVPILVTQSEAAELVRAGIDTFRQEVKDGKWPRHVLKRGRIKLFDRREIERRIDQMGGVESNGVDFEKMAMEAGQNG